MKRVTGSAPQNAKARAFHWCRRQNGFSDLPIWRLVARKSEQPLAVVLAFVNRLEELGNASANYGDPRGSVVRFSANEFAVALDIAPNEATRIYDELAHPEIGWIAYDHIANFYDRNPDRPDETNADRQRRFRRRDKILKLLVQAVQLGRMTLEARADVEQALPHLQDDELERMHSELAGVTQARLSTVTRYERVTDQPQKSDEPQSVTRYVTSLSRVTNDREEKIITTGAVDNSGDSARGMAEGLAAEMAAEALVEADTQWIDDSGVKLLVTMLNVRPQQAVLYVERWRRDLNDEAALADFIRAADKAGHIGERFHAIITDQIKRHIFTRDHGAGLPLGPAVVSSQMPAASPELAASIERLRRKHG